MSQAYGRMYHPHPHHSHHSVHSQGPPFRQAGEVSQHHHQGYSSQRGYHQSHYTPPPQQPRLPPAHSSYGNSVSVYSVPKPSRPYNNFNNRRGRGGGPPGRGGYHNHNNHSNHHSNHHPLPPGNHQGYGGHAHSSYRPQLHDFDLEWDHYDFSSEESSGKRSTRARKSGLKQGGPAALNDAELEWDDYDLRPKEEIEEENPDTLDYILTEGVFPLIGVVTKAPLSRGHIPLGAIQVCRFPQAGAFKTLTAPDHFSKSLRLNKDLLVLTSELNEGTLFSSGLESPPETKDYLLADLAQTRDKDSRLSPSSSSGKDGESEGASNGVSEEDLDEDFLSATYESAYQDRLGDIELYALAPHDFDSPDSTFSRSLADLTDISLYEELGIDPNLLRLGLERSRSLGDGTRVHDATKHSILKGVKSKKRKRKGLEKAEDSLTAGGEDGADRKTKRLAPNFFVAIQVSNPEIHEALKDVQQTVVTGDEKLKDAMVPIATLHLTIMVMHLATDEDVERAKVALNECHHLLSPRFTKEKLSILFGGLGHFNNQVMFAKIKDQDNILESLYEIADTVEKCFSDYQLVSTGERGFKPHLTVMKLSRAPSLRKKGVRRIKSELYKTHNAQVFGMQVVNGLQLCSINKPKTADGYYSKAAEVMFGEPTLEPCRDIHPITEGEEPPVWTASHRDTTPELPGSPDVQPDADGIISAESMSTDAERRGLTSVDENRNVPVDVKHPTLGRPDSNDKVNSDNDDDASNASQTSRSDSSPVVAATTSTRDNASSCSARSASDAATKDASDCIQQGARGETSPERLSEPPPNSSRSGQGPPEPTNQINGDKLKGLTEDRLEERDGSPTNPAISSPETS